MMSDTDLIDKLGGTAKVAALCGLSPAAISLWRRRGIPQPWRMFLQVKYPNVFKEVGNG